MNGEPLGAIRPKDTIEILSFEATRSPLIARDAPKVAELAYRLRVMGSLALSLCHLAAGRVDAVCSLKPARSVDIAAAQLLVREAGLAIELFDDSAHVRGSRARSRRTFTRRGSGNRGAVQTVGGRPIHIGCSGWNYASWKQEFYEGCRRGSGSSTTRATSTPSR